MTNRSILALTSLGAALVALAAACGGGQPKPQCTIGRGGHAVRYTLKTGIGACASKAGEIVGAQAYRITDPTHADYGKPPKLALRPHTLAVLEGQDTDTTHSTSSLGSFTSDLPGDDSWCQVPSMTTDARQVTPGGADITYKWRNVRIYDSAPIPGTQWMAELEYTENGCTATYEAVGVFPAISCATSTGGTDVALCKNRFLGLSLDPAYLVTCDTVSKLCMLEGNPPATR